MAVDRKAFREAMSRLGSAVNIITLADATGRHGFTASAVCSVTDDPPTMLVCINRGARVRDCVLEGAAICINTLAANQKDLSVNFAAPSTMEERFKLGTWATLVTGAPVLEEAMIACDCRVARIVEVGTHSVVFCEVNAIHLGNAEDSLMYFARAYHALPLSAARGP
jgi:flavin reductase